MRFAKHDHVVETFAADRADESLNISILPGRSGCDRVVPNAHGTDPLHEDWTIRGISIPNEISRRVVPRERLGDLARDPVRGWVCRHAKRHPKSSSVAHNDKTIQNLECDRRQNKEVDRRDAVGGGCANGWFGKIICASSIDEPGQPIAAGAGRPPPTAGRSSARREEPAG